MYFHCVRGGLVWLAILLPTILGQDTFTGPRIFEQPEDLLIVGSYDEAVFLCRAEGFPEPSYQWVTRTQLSPEWKTVDLYPYLNPHSNGTLSLDVDSLVKSKGQTDMEFQCQVKNLHGTVLSRVARLGFGGLGFLDKVPARTVNVTEYEHVHIDCPYVSAKPNAVYSWYRNNNPNDIVSPDAYPEVFATHTGQLYFSPAMKRHEGVYHCVVLLSTAGSGYRTIEGDQSYSVTIHRNGITLNVEDNPSGAPLPNYDPPVILDGFISIWPEKPIVGDHIQIQCFAYDTQPRTFQYKLALYDLTGMPIYENDDGIVVSNRNRSMTITFSRLEQTGMLECRVTGERGTETVAWKELTISSKPKGDNSNTNHLVSEGFEYSLNCNPSGNPTPNVTWYKNGEKLDEGTMSLLGVKTFGSELFFKELDVDDHSGMYQCESSNYLGTAYSTSQITFRSVVIDPPFGASQREHATFSVVGVMAMTVTYFLLSALRG